MNTLEKANGLPQSKLSQRTASEKANGQSFERFLKPRILIFSPEVLNTAGKGPHCGTDIFFDLKSDHPS